MADDALPTQQYAVDTCYDDLFSIVLRLRRIGDIDIPIWGGISINQAMTFIATVIVSAVLWNTIGSPISNSLGGAPAWMSLLFIVGPAVLAANRVTKPFPYGMSFSDWAITMLRNLLDDPFRRDGQPMPTPRDPWTPQLRVQRVWTEYDRDVVTTRDTDRAAAIAGAGGDVGAWSLDHIVEARREWMAELKKQRAVNITPVSYRRDVTGPVNDHADDMVEEIQA